MASKPRRCELFLLYNYFCHLTNAREPAGKEGRGGLGCHDVAGHQPVRKNIQRERMETRRSNIEARNDVAQRILNFRFGRL